ncbi:uncharacterized protein LOC143022349 [Oratosquilla oratoria]|uniref:uncharacterized protein LOC143022349 n=1 Tax=Oratosquilla oratoria TaxID=337810 RepID=UPI003F76B07B
MAIPAAPEPRVEILRAPDLYVQRDSMINLTCILHDVPEPPVFVLWYHGNKNMSLSSSRGGFSMVIEKGPTTISYLLLQNAREEDSGIYRCAPSNLNATSIRVHVLNGELPAAMQTNSSHHPTPRHLLHLLVLPVLLLLLPTTTPTVLSTLLLPNRWVEIT